jgi:hypothetical protein
MSTTDWPAALRPSQAQWQLVKSGAQFASPFNGTLQAVDYLAERWAVSLTLPPARNAGATAALLNWLSGGVNRVRVWHSANGGMPSGTIIGTPVLNAAVGRGDTALVLSACGVGTTLLAGDYIGVGGHLLQIAADATANGGGFMAISTINRVRSTIAYAAAVTYYRPTAEFVMPAMQAGPVLDPGASQPVALDLVEVW